MAQEATRTLEQVRQRLQTLSNQLASLRRDLETNEVLPSWTSIQNSASLLSHNLQSLHATLDASAPLLRAAHAYPLPSFPARTHEHSLAMLMRKKLQPPVEDWIADGAGRGRAMRGRGDGSEGHGLCHEELGELWGWAGGEGNRIAREIGDEAFGDVFTLEEQEAGVENVVTGLRRRFWESDDEEEGEGKGEEMEVDAVDARPEVVKGMDRADVDPSKKMLPLEMMLKFMSTGTLPPGSSISTV